MTSNRDDSTLAASLIAATIPFVAEGGVDTVDADAICHAAGRPRDAVRRAFGTTEVLIFHVTQSLCDVPVFPEPVARGIPTTVEDTLLRLAVQHRRYADHGPDRYRAILQLTSAAIFGRPELIAPLAERNVRSRQAVATHLSALRARGVIDPTADLGAIASAFVDIANGIEMCFLIDRDDAGRRATYREAAAALAAALAPSRDP